MIGMPMRVAAVVLTYNSTEDLSECLSGLISQTGIDLRVIVVDNASRPDALELLEADFLAALPDGRILDAASARAEKFGDLKAIFLRNEVNEGYSAGNNIGARIAVKMGCKAVLIINPDVRIADQSYVRSLSELITANEHTAVACSSLRNLSGALENPMKELSYLEEVLWPIFMIVSPLRRIRTSPVRLMNYPFKVEKVSGACFMIRTDFLKRIEYFDDSVFLYGEESVLMAQVKSEGWHMVMDPQAEAIHAHRHEAKGNPLPRYQALLQSRAYFHQKYSGYGPLKLKLLETSQKMSFLLFYVRQIARRWIK